MSNKITCTCGHSWNKSSSSKKDMRICHICGKDNTMKNGGWLDVYDVPQAQLGISTSDNTFVKKPIIKNPIGGPNDPDVMKYNEVKKDEQWKDPYTFLMNWYTDPETKKRLKAQGAPETPMTEALNQKLYNNYDDWRSHSRDKNRKDAEAIWKNDYSKANEFTNFLNQSLDSRYDDLIRTSSGFHDAKDSTVALSNFGSDRTKENMNVTAVHELTHATPLDNFYIDYFKKNKPKDAKWLEEDYFSKNPVEIYPRIQDLRYQMQRDKKIAPGTKITPSLLEGYNNNSDLNLRNYYSPEELSKIMNEVAYAPNVNNPIRQAQNGIEASTDGFTNQGFNYNGAWGGTMEYGGDIPQAQNGLWNTNKTQWVDSIHNARRGDLDFVNRYFDHSAGSIPTPRDVKGWKPGQTSTHLMAYDPGTRRVYPAVVNVKGKLQYMPGDQGWNYADDTKQFIEFPTAEQAKWYSNNGYKKGTDVLKEKSSAPKKAMGGSMPGSVGFSYARTGDIPSNGPYAKKTLASAQDGLTVDEQMAEASTNMWGYPIEPNFVEAYKKPTKKTTSKKTSTKSKPVEEDVDEPYSVEEKKSTINFRANRERPQMDALRSQTPIVLDRYNPYTGYIREGDSDPNKWNDSRSIFSDARAKERGEQLWDGTKKVTALTQFIPGPIGKTSKVLNTSMGLTDAYYANKANDPLNTLINIAGAIPSRNYYLSGLQALSDLTDNFGLEKKPEKKQNGGEVEYKELPEIVVVGKNNKSIKKREDFEPWWNWGSIQAAGGERRQQTYGNLGDLYAYYAGQPLKHNVLEHSQYKPTNSKNPKADYISINDSKFKQEIIDNYNRVFNEKKLLRDEKQVNDNTYSVSGYTRPIKEQMKKNKAGELYYEKGKDHVSNAIGHYFLSRGKDNKGDYISYYDVFDAHTGPDGGGVGETLGLTKPFELYDRIYLDPKTGKPKFQNGGEMSFYQNGLDWTPRNISKQGSKIKKDDNGYWNPENWGKPVEIGSNNITMQGVYEPLIGVSDEGDVQYMEPEQDYKFKGKKVTEYPVAQKGLKVPPLNVSDPNDPRLKSYQDSLYNYNVGKRMAGILDADKNLMKVRPGSPYDKLLQAGLKANNNNLQDNTKKNAKGYKNYEKIADVMREYQAKGNRGILPIRFQGYFPNPDNTAVDLVTLRSLWDKLGVTDPRPTSAAHLPEWKKPEQEVVLNPPSNVPKKPQPKPKPQPVKKKPTPQPKPVQEQPTKKPEKPIPVERKQNTYEGSPAYSATLGSGEPSALVGFVNPQGDTTYIKPEDYQRYGVPAYGKEYIESKTKKKKNGGWLDKYN